MFVLSPTYLIDTMNHKRCGSRAILARVTLRSGGKENELLAAAPSDAAKRTAEQWPPSAALSTRPQVISRIRICWRTRYAIAGTVGRKFSSRPHDGGPAFANGGGASSSATGAMNPHTRFIPNNGRSQGIYRLGEQFQRPGYARNHVCQGANATHRRRN